MAAAPDGVDPVRRDLGLHDSEPILHLLGNLFVVYPGGRAGADQRVHKVLANQCEPMGRLAVPSWWVMIEALIAVYATYQQSPAP